MNDTQLNAPTDSVDVIYGIVREPSNHDDSPAPLNFLDGNIILETGTISMRVHAGILALNSRAFTRLFASYSDLGLSGNPAVLRLDVATSDFVAYIDAVYNRSE